MLTGVLTLGAFSFVTVLILGLASRRFAGGDDVLIERVNQLLPQTQCAQCGYPGCQPYAQAIVREQAPIDLCPPGGTTTLSALEQLLDKEQPTHRALGDATEAVAKIRERDCIGCALCVQACPVDAIVGAPQWMHTVIESDCTGCELCIAPCPVDCIEMETRESQQAMAPTAALPCIHCNACTVSCPVSLEAQQLYQLTANDQTQAALDAGLGNCIECEVCEDVCPSNIPLLAFFRYTRAQADEAARQQRQANIRQQRYEARNVRLARQENKTHDAAQLQKQRLKEKIMQKPVMFDRQ